MSFTALSFMMRMVCWRFARLAADLRVRSPLVYWSGCTPGLASQRIFIVLGSPDDLLKIVRSLVSVFKACGRDEAIIGLPMLKDSVADAQGRRRGCVTTVDHL
jgi:hypothetical protein